MNPHMNFSHYLEVTFLGFPDFAPRIPAPEVLVTAGTIVSKMMKGTSADIMALVLLQRGQLSPAPVGSGNKLRAAHFPGPQQVFTIYLCFCFSPLFCFFSSASGLVDLGRGCPHPQSLISLVALIHEAICFLLAFFFTS